MATSGLFPEMFAALAGYVPLRWQSRLFARLANGAAPAAINLPTGLGKTAIIPIWLIATAEQGCVKSKGSVNGRNSHLPRRLVYIVNRRTVVDQATHVVERMRKRLRDPGNQEWIEHKATLEELASRLRTLSATGEEDCLFGVTTLRGEFADNEEWKADPARPAIIVGTMDMIGSKLLFSGYGDGRYGRAHHAGLIGQDTLLVHDEAHLTPAFDALLDAVKSEQERTREARRIQKIRLSATARGSGDGAAARATPFGIEDEDRDDPVVKERLSACKQLAILDAEKDKVAQTIAAKALELGRDGARVLVYVRSPETAQEVRKGIIKGVKQRAKDAGVTVTDEEATSRVGLLTGTIRGHERDALAESPLFKAFQSRADRDVAGDTSGTKALFLVSTSAGEVGADWDADHLVSDLTTLDSMIQRFGRVNRLGGERRQAQIVIVMEEADTSGEENETTGAGGPARKGNKKGANDYESAVLMSGEILRRVATQGGDVSPGRLGEVIQGLSDEDKQTAFSPTPRILPATDVLFDHWSLTSIASEMPGRPAVEDYLHGVSEWEPPETHVVWRADIALLARAGGAGDDGEPLPCSRDDLVHVFDAFRLRSEEALRDRTDRVQEELRKIASRLRNASEERKKPSGHGALACPSDSEEAGVDDEAGAITDASGDGTGARANSREAIEPDPWVVLIQRGEPKWERLESLAPMDKNQAKARHRDLAFAKVVLPVEAGGFKDGMLVGQEAAPANARTIDVAESARQSATARQRVRVKGKAAEALLGGGVLEGVTRASLTLPSGGNDDAEPERIEYRVAKGQEREPGQRVPIADHNKAVGESAERIGKALGLETTLVEALRIAGKWHDAGKARAVWQRYANNANGAEPLAKSDGYGHWKMLGGYRHEFGSVLDASAAAQIHSLDVETRDLVLHLIAAHHGWGRPNFEPQHFDRGDAGEPVPTALNEAMAVEVMQRFGRLQQRFGRWGLAWLESLLRCADAESSRQAATPKFA